MCMYDVYDMYIYKAIHVHVDRQLQGNCPTRTKKDLFGSGGYNIHQGQPNKVCEKPPNVAYICTINIYIYTYTHIISYHIHRQTYADSQNMSRLDKNWISLE